MAGEALGQGGLLGALLTPQQQQKMLDDIARRRAEGDPVQAFSDWMTGFSTGAYQGATFGWGDELEARLAAIGPRQSYEPALAQVRQRNAAIAERNPVAMTVGDIAGGIAMPAFGMAKAATIPFALGKYGAMATLGAGYGALSGAGYSEGSLAERLPGAAVGAGIGAVAAPALGWAVPKVAKAAGDALNDAGLWLQRTMGWDAPRAPVTVAANAPDVLQRATSEAYLPGLEPPPPGTPTPGLDMSPEGRWTRARRLGYTDDLFHETRAANVESIAKKGFDPGFVDQRQGDFLPNGTYLKAEPETIGVVRDPTEEVQMPLKVRTGNLFEAEDRADFIEKISDLDDEIGDLMRQTKEWQSKYHDVVMERAQEAMDRGDDAVDIQAIYDDVMDNEVEPIASEARERVTELLRDMGYDGVHLKGDVGGPFGMSVDTTIMFDPSDIRSRFAKFDPAFADQPQIMANEPQGLLREGGANRPLQRAPLPPLETDDRTLASMFDEIGEPPPKTQLRANLSAATDRIGGTAALMQKFRAGDLEAGETLSTLASESLLRRTADIPSLELTTKPTVGLYFGDAEPSLGISAVFDEADRAKVIAALAGTGGDWEQSAVYTLAEPPFDARGIVGFKYDDGSFNTVAYRWPLTEPLDRAAAQQLIDESGLVGLTIADDYIEAYYAGSPDDPAGWTAFADGTKKLSTLLAGRGGSPPVEGAWRFTRYGEEPGAIPYSQVSTVPADATPPAAANVARIRGLLEDEGLDPAAIDDLLQRSVIGRGRGAQGAPQAYAPKVTKRAGLEDWNLKGAVPADRYIDPGEPVAKVDPKTGKAYVSKGTSAEAEALLAAKQAAQADIIADDYEPFFDVAQRRDVDPAQYGILDEPKTLDVAGPRTAKKAAAVAKWFDDPMPAAERKALEGWVPDNAKGMARRDIGAERLKHYYEIGAKDPGSKLWYAMGQLEDAFIEELGPVAGREQFQRRFVDAMAAMTAGLSPEDNLRLAAYVNYLSSHGLDAPDTAMMPAGIGAGRYGIKQSFKVLQQMAEEGLSPANPKRYNFARNFLGMTDPVTLDEQMARVLGYEGALFAKGRTYPAFEQLVADTAKELGVTPRELQEVVWAGFKMAEGKGSSYKPRPMIEIFNRALARTSKMTGEPQAKVLKRFIRASGPLYGLLGAAGVGGLLTDEEE